MSIFGPIEVPENPGMMCGFCGTKFWGWHLCPVPTQAATAPTTEARLAELERRVSELESKPMTPTEQKKPKQTRSEQAKRKAEIRKLEEAVLRAAEEFETVAFTSVLEIVAKSDLCDAVSALRAAKARAGK